MKIYIASSWRNELQPLLVKAFRESGHEVYDFRNPKPDNAGFHWSEIDPKWQSWTSKEFKAALFHPIAVDGFKLDWEAMHWAEACILVLPSGRSAHLEAGYFIGARKPLHILLNDGEPELMYKMATNIYTGITDLLKAFAD